MDSRIESIIEIESHFQNLQCFTIQGNVFKSKFSRDEVENFRGFALSKASFWPKIKNFEFVP